MESRWKSEELARTFLEGVRGAIPGAALQLEVIRKIVSAWQPSASRVLDLGCGDGILGRTLMEELPSAHFLFVDFSGPMLAALRDRLPAGPSAAVYCADFSTAAWLRAVSSAAPVDVVVSGFAIHHQPDERKRAIYEEIYRILGEGGVFLNLEHVKSSGDAGEQLFDLFFVDHLVRFHREASPQKSVREIEDGYYNRPDKAENILAPVGLQCEWLREIGFQDVDCFFKVFELALFGGRKPARSPD
jgi:tRNA (cmo5U34)-methyltransferase